TAFLGGEPYVSFVDVDDERWEIAIGIEVRQHLDVRLSILIGEILHNLRSCLDHALWQLVLHEGGTPHNRTGFPIYLKDAGFESETLDTSRRRGMLVGLSPKSVAEIRSLQPFETGEDSASPLWQLHELHNFEKHRALILAACQLRQMKVEIGPLAQGKIPAQRIDEDSGPFHEDAIITRLFIPSWFLK